MISDTSDELEEILLRTRHHNVKDKFENERSNDDLVTKCVGDFGKWQLRIAILMGLIKLPLAWYQLNITFLAPTQDFWCAKPKSKYFEIYSDEEWRKMAIPITEPNPCLIFDPEVLKEHPFTDRTSIPLIECPEFVYDKSIFERTIVTDWNLVCKNRWKVQFTQIVMMWGVLLGGLIFGSMSDKYGRRYTLMMTSVIQTITGILSGLMPTYELFIINHLILATCVGGLSVVSFVIPIEVVGGKWRTIIPIVCQLPFGLGSTVMALVAYNTKDWRMLNMNLGIITSFLLILCYIWVPESPRWLFAMGQNDKAIEILREAARINSIELNSNCYSQVKNFKKRSLKDNNNITFMSYIRKPNMRKKTILLSLEWFIVGLVYMAFSQYLGVLKGNIFLIIAISGLTYTPGVLICIYAVNLGRKASILTFQFVTALCVLGLLIISYNSDVNSLATLVSASIGMCGLAGAVPALSLYSAELYPTIGRSIGLGTVATFCRLGSILAPLFIGLDSIMNHLTLIVLVVLSFAQLLLIMPLPETRNCRLPITLDEAENFRGC